MAEDRPCGTLPRRRSPSPKKRTPAPCVTIGGRRLRLARGITVDSGAADNVMPRRLLRGRAKIRDSEASLQGVHYVAANNSRIKNEGEADFQFKTRDGQSMSWLFQVAEVNKTLAAVSALVDSGHRVTFDRDEETGVDVSFITHKKSGASVQMRRERNVWVIDAFVDDDNDDMELSTVASTAELFSRQE